MNRPEVFSRTLQEGDLWIKELCQELRTDNVNTAYAALRSVLHELRDRLIPDEAVQLAAQLPMLICGLYFDGWKPSKTPSEIDTVQEFLRGVQDRARGHGELDPKFATMCVFRILSRRVSEGEIADVIHLLPQEIQTLWPDQPDNQRNPSEDKANTQDSRGKSRSQNNEGASR